MTSHPGRLAPNSDSLTCLIWTWSDLVGRGLHVRNSQIIFFDLMSLYTLCVDADYMFLRGSLQ